LKLSAVARGAAPGAVGRKPFRQLDDFLPIFSALYFYEGPYQFQTLEEGGRAATIGPEQFV
jgi:hypothetical protein